MTSYPPEVQECPDPVVRARALRAFQSGTNKEKADCMREISALNKKTLEDQKEKRNAAQKEEWDQFLSLCFRYYH